MTHNRKRVEFFIYLLKMFGVVVLLSVAAVQIYVAIDTEARTSAGY